MSVAVDRLKPILRYPGAKYRLAPWIVSLFPPHDLYLEPFAGSATVLLAKTPSRSETISDLNGRLVNFFRVLRDEPERLVAKLALTPYARAEWMESREPSDDPLEDARRFAVMIWMSFAGKHGTPSGWRHDMNAARTNGAMPREWAGLPDRIWPVAQRLRQVHIECRPALDMIAAAAAGSLIYADPPYLPALIGTDRMYAHTMTNDEHIALLHALVAHPGPVVLSAYRSDLYDALLPEWMRLDRPVIVYRGSVRVESVYVNPLARGRIAQQRLRFDAVTS